VTRRALVVGLVVLLAASVAAGADAASGKRLSKAQWTKYTSANKTFVSANSKGIAKFRTCSQRSHAASPSQAADVFKTCLDGTVPKLTKATQKFGVTLRGFQKSVSGDCTQKLNVYIGSLFSWTNVINGINHAVQLGQVPSTANVPTAYDQITSSAAAFKKACKPL
jgi:hypothetical protein